MMPAEPQTRHSAALPELRFSLGLLYVGRLLMGMHPTVQDDRLDDVDEHIEAVTDELIATELLHEAAVLAGDVAPCNPDVPAR